MQPTDLSSLVKKELQDFIVDHENADERKLVLRHKVIHGIPAAVVAAQISGRRKAKVKLPTWYQTHGMVYPPSVNLEQSSSEFTARFKANMIAETNTSNSMRGVDLTAGFGVDSFYLSRVCEKWDCVDPDFGLLEMAKHNHELLGAANIHYHPTTAEGFITSSHARFDFAFIDPARRSRSKKVFKLTDCEPNVVQILSSIFEKTDRLLVKASPLLDLHQGCVELGRVEKIIVVAVENECKEVLFWCTKDAIAEASVRCTNLSSGFPKIGLDEFTFTFSEEKTTTSVFSDPLTYLYEPNAAILKAGAFKTVGRRYGFFKLHVNTHLYTSDQWDETFPGRIFKIEDLKPDPSRFRTRHGGKVNVFTRNYPFRPEQLKKKLKLQDGGEKYLIGFSGEKKKYLVVAARLK